MRRCLPALLLAACGSSAAPAPDAAPLPPTRELDLLFVIDDSGTSPELQDHAMAGAAALLDGLRARFGGELPDLHIGVISGNLGDAGAGIPGCDGNGDDGMLHTRTTCGGPDGAFISDVADGAGGRARNYDSELHDVLTCTGRLGIGGCGFQQHLEAIRRALDGRNPGFVRPGALLAIVIVADDDDCSAADPILYTPAEDTPLGPLSSFRCARFGWLCDGAPLPDAAGTYEDCEPRGDSYLQDPADLVALLATVKPDPRSVIVAGAFPDRSPVVVTLDQDGHARHNNICGMYPHSTNIRDRAVVDAFGGTWIDGCDTDLGAGFAALADQLADRMGY